MNIQRGKLLRFRQVFLMFLMAVVQPTSAQEQQSQSPVTESADAKTTNTKQEAADQNGEKNKQDGSVGKSKLERETGTVNDRIFEVLPNYGTVENATELPPISTGQKFRLATAGVFDWAAYPFNGLLAAIDQAKDQPKSWGQDRDGAPMENATALRLPTTASAPI